jgi:hypothetical protein
MTAGGEARTGVGMGPTALIIVSIRGDKGSGSSQLFR